MDGDEATGTLSARGQKTARVNWRAIGLKLAWPLIGLFALGSVALWWSSFEKLITVGGFAGIISWQILGFFLPVYQGRKVYWRLMERDIEGRFKTPPVTRQRLKAIVGIIAFNAVANAAAIVLIVWNIALGRLVMTRWDWVCIILSATILAGLMIWQRTNLTKSQLSMFLLAAGTRMLPQLCLTFSVDLAMIPWYAIGGVGIIAFQRFVTSSIELADARSQRLSGRNIKAAWWVWLGDLANTLTIAVPIIAKLLL